MHCTDIHSSRVAQLVTVMLGDLVLGVVDAFGRVTGKHRPTPHRVEPRWSLRMSLDLTVSMTRVEGP